MGCGVRLVCLIGIDHNVVPLPGAARAERLSKISSPGFSGLSSIDIGCPLEQVAQLSSAIRDMVWHSAWDIERRG
jgi:hypothetical protein